jgi:SAM-dependent methyltransferase
LKILFATAAPVRQTPAGLTSDLASARYRVLIPAQQLGRLGHQVQIAGLAGDTWPAEVLAAPVDAVVISKSFQAANEALASAMKARGAKVVVDFCDDHFEHAELGPHLRRLAALADVVIASTGMMAEAVRRHAGRDATVITDPVEGPRGMPAFAPALPSLKLAWFGHPSNLRGLSMKSAELAALVQRVPVRLRLVTAASDDVRQFASQLAGADPSRLKVELVAWTPDAAWRSLAECDAVWLPAEESSRTSVKSPNRLVEAIWAGRFVVADPVPSYMPFADVMPIGKGLLAGMQEALDAPDAARARIAAAQRRVARDHSAYECGRRWALALGDRQERPMRLNLGCGDKILPGYVNVDVVEARAGMKPDVVCDLHDLAPFDDAIADEILSVHVVEHFWRWEIRDVLREWVRVLKPGARMIVECPNILSACRTFLENPEQFSREDQNGQRTMWVFYGDPKWKDPLMIHRWGYTPESLKALLAEVGLADVRQEPAQFKLREPRDMRMVGVKP